MSSTPDRKDGALRRWIRRVLRWAERLFLVVGAICVAWVLETTLRATIYQLYAKSELDHVAARELPADAWRPSILEPPSPDDSLIGVLTIPSVNLSVAIVEGDDDQALRIAAGHLADTPLPWDEGNSAFAGHRDTFFNPLQDLRVGDEMSLATRHGTFRYRVVVVTIVAPDDLSVLGPTGNVSLTLITCYPFSYLGPAPQRFIVQADRVTPSLLGAIR
jgi:sortase A